MKRDLDLVRQILLVLEGHPTGFAPVPKIEGYTDEQIGYHVLLMKEAGLLIAIETTGRGDTTPTAIPSRMTWAGHEFLDAAREPKRWDQAKAISAKARGVAFDVLVRILTRLATDAADKALAIAIEG